MEKEWERMDVQRLLSELYPPTTERLKELRKEYEGLFFRWGTTLHKKHHHLVFGHTIEERMDLNDDMLQLLIGRKWRQHQNLCYQKHKDQVVGASISQIDLADVKPPYSLSHFNLLSHHRGIKFTSVSGDGKVQISPVVNIVIALSLRACIIGRGIFLWTRKKRSQSPNHADWHKAPDILFLNHIWSDEERVRFREASYEQMRDTLCANLNPLLSDNDIVLPFLLDFPGESLKNPEDARISLDVDDNLPPKAAISIPGAAYIGWLDEMGPPLSRQIRREKAGAKSGGGYRAEATLTPRQRRQTRVEDVGEMYQKAVNMFDNPRQNGLMSYKDVLMLMNLARRSMVVGQKQAENVKKSHTAVDTKQ